MRAKDLLAIVKLGEKDAPCAAFSYVLLAPRGVAFHGPGFAVRYAAPKGESLAVSSPIAVPSTWLRDVLGPSGAGAKGAVAFEPFTQGEKRDPAARAMVRGKRFESAALPVGELPRALVAPASVASADLAPSDFAKGGPVASVIPCASRDERRAHVNAVHLADDATATDGHKLARKALRARLPFGLLVPLAMAKGLVAMVDATAPARLVVRHDAEKDHVWFTARTADGARWTLSGRVTDVASAPNYAAAVDGVTAYSACDVDVAELRAVARGATHVAVLPCGGLVAWTSTVDTAYRVASGELAHNAGVAVSLDSWDGAAEPLITFQGDTLRAALGSVPKAGKVRVSVDAAGGFGNVGGTLVAGLKGGPKLPTFVATDLAHMFGLACELPIARPAPGDVVTSALRDAFASGAKLACGCSEDPCEHASSPTIAADAQKRGAIQAGDLAAQCAEAVAKGDFSRLAASLASAVLALSRPTDRTGGTFLAFDAAAFLAAALPATPVAPSKAKRGGKRDASVKVAA